MRSETTIEPIRPGARVRISEGNDADPKWLVQFGARNGVLGTVVHFRTIPRGRHREAIVQLDRSVVFEDVIGSFLVLRLHDNTTGWESGTTVSVELCDFEPNTHFARCRGRSVTVETAAVCELL